MQQLWRLGATELAVAIRNRSVSVREVVQAHLDRIDAVNRRVNAVAPVAAERALAAAAAADRAISSDEPAGPLHGVPITVKENIDVAGSPTTWGVAALANAVPSVDAPHVAHLRAAGAIIIGRTNLPDFALRWHTSSGLRGATLNPWNSARTPGGSSGGEAAALATGMTPLGVGNDVGGSLRWPAQCCGIASLRPTLGRIPDASSLPPVDWPAGIQLMNVQGPMARRIQDLRAALEVMSRPSPRDPWYVPAPLAGPQHDSPIRVAVARNPGNHGVDPTVAAGIDSAARVLTEAGYVVEEAVPPDVDRAAEVWGQLIAADMRALQPTLVPLLSDEARQSFALEASLLPPIDLPVYASLFVVRQALLRAWSIFLASRPLVLAPIGTAPPFAVGADLAEDTLPALVHSMRMIVAINLLGLPSVAVPVGVAAGLPQAVQIIGARYREDLCLDAAEAIEAGITPITPIDPV
jgi:amidase